MASRPSGGPGTPRPNVSSRTRRRANVRRTTGSARAGPTAARRTPTSRLRGRPAPNSPARLHPSPAHPSSLVRSPVGAHSQARPSSPVRHPSPVEVRSPALPSSRDGRGPARSSPVRVGRGRDVSGRRSSPARTSRSPVLGTRLRPSPIPSSPDRTPRAHTCGARRSRRLSSRRGATPCPHSNHSNSACPGTGLRPATSSARWASRCNRGRTGSTRRSRSPSRPAGAGASRRGLRAFS